jgi:hypothetical protein
MATYLAIYEEPSEFDGTTIALFWVEATDKESAKRKVMPRIYEYCYGADGRCLKIVAVEDWGKIDLDGVVT